MISRIMWGTGLENALVMEFPLYDIVTDREWREGSEIIQVGSIDEAWWTGSDYTLVCEVRWIRDGGDTYAPVSGALGWQAFLDWARNTNTFRFVPDETVPDFYIDGCSLVEPRKGFGGLTADIKRKTAFKIRNPTMDFHQALRGIMFEYAPGMSLTDPVAATFSRASAATRRGLPSTSMAAAIGASELTGVLRDRHYEGSLRTTLLEAARTQLVTDPENFGAWSVDATPIRTSGQADPFGGTAGYLFNDDDATAAERVWQIVGFTADATKALSVFMRAGTSVNSMFGLFDLTAGVWRHRVNVAWSGAGVPTLTTDQGTGTLFAVENWGGGWYRLSASVNAVVAANTNRFYLLPTQDIVGQTGTAYFFGANAWNAAFPSSYQGPSLGTRSADALSWPHIYKPQAMFWLVEFVLRNTDYAMTWSLDDSGGSGARIGLEGDTSSWSAVFFNPTQQGSGGIGGAAFGNSVRHLVELTGAGVTRVHQSLNGAAETVSGASAGQALPAVWGVGSPVFRLNRYSGGLDGHKAFARVKVGPLTFGGITRDTIAKALAA
jgi:hypothetical protein